ncbi:type II toxin-antitoxin system VapC family toxin [Candidatus Gottesmanbacteria bacterium]|nr:type II toxin-antitoxin system VapC family toxin [Candidatus Gottesmanbacteria bacterium]
MSNSLRVIADADAIVAQVSPNDSLHLKAVKTAENLVKTNAQLLYPVTAVIEATTHIQRVLNSGATAYGTAAAFTDSNVSVIEVNQETLKHAMQFFSPTTSKKNTIYDCIVAALAEENDADAIFSFDKFYKSKGFKLASDMSQLK